MDGIGGDAGGRSGASPSDAVMMVPTPDNSMVEDPPESRPKHLSNDQESSRQDNPPIPFNTPVSLESTQLTQPQSPPPPPSRQNMLPPLPPLSSPSSVPSSALAPSWSQTRSPTSAPSNPFYTSAYRSSTPPIPSSAEQSPIISPAKRFSSGEVKPLFTPNSPRQPLNEEDRIKFTQLATQLKTRLTYAAIKVENGWEKHSFSQIKSLLNEEQKPSQHYHHQQRRRSHTIQETPSNLTLPPGGGVGKQLTYESFWASHSQQRHHQQPSHTNPGVRSSQPFHHATFPRRKPERLSLQGIAQGHTARDQSAAEIMIALASPRTRSEFSSPERNIGGNVDTDEEKSPPPSEGFRARKRVELDKDVDGLGIHA